MIRLLSRSDVIAALTMDAAIEGMKHAYSALSMNEVDMPLRSRIKGQVGGVTLIMPAHLQTTAAMGIKVVSVFPENVTKNLPLIHGFVVALNAETGQALALMDGGSLTAIRTGAGSGAATDVLARSDARTVAIIGSGVQARTQLEAVCAVREIETVWVYSRTASHAHAFAEMMGGQGAVPSDIRTADTAQAAIQDADIICTATTSSNPVFDGRHLKAGTHINAVGSYLPTMQEVDHVTLQRASIFVDSQEAVMAEAGEIIIALAQGAIQATDVQVEIGSVIHGDQPGRQTDTDITYFKSVGIAVQDAVAASIAYRTAEAQGLGILFDIDA